MIEIFLHIKRISNGFIKGNRLSWIRKFGSAEMSFIFLTILYPLVIIFGLEIFYIINTVILISIILSVRDNETLHHNYWSLLCKCVLICSVIVQVSGLLFFIFIFVNIDDSNVFLSVTTLIGLLAYISLVIAFILGLVNFLFYVSLKIMFPHESETSIENQSFTFIEISPFMSLQQQVAYFILSMLHFSIYLIFVAFVLGSITKIINKESDNEIIKKLEIWIVNSDLISIGNALGLISVIIALLTITVPFQMKIMNKVYEKHNE